ncbi:shufflon system plasmid conjugative transfer pilus tip adhesin PilV [Pantoea sp. XAF26B01_ASV70]
MPTQKLPDRGWALISTGAALIVLVFITTWGSSLIQDWQARQNWLRSATQASRFTQAVKSYSGRYYDTLQSTAPVTITPAMLKNTGFLEPGFTETNDYGQRYLASVVRNSSQNNQLQALVYTQNGSQLPFMAMDQIAISINSGMGGYINTAGTVTGARGGWSAPLQTFNASTTPGHIAALLTTDELGASRAESDRLYRFAVNGKPDLNTMHTSIDMGGNNLNNTGNVNAANGNFSSNVTAAGTVTGQDVNARGNMNAGNAVSANGTVTGQDVNARGNIFAANSIAANGDIRSNGGWFITRDGKGWLDESHGGGFYMSDNDWVRVVNNKNIYTGGLIRGGNVRADGDISAGGILYQDSINMENTSCSPDGAISHQADGALLSCQSRVWRLQSATKTIVSASSDVMRFSAATATCPAPKKVVGGGGNCESLTHQGTVWLVTSIPSGDASWFAYCDSTKNQIIRSTSYAICE